MKFAAALVLLLTMSVDAWVPVSIGSTKGSSCVVEPLKMAPYDSEVPGNNNAYVDFVGGIPKINKPKKTTSEEKLPSADWDRQEIVARALLEARLEMEKRGSTEAPAKKEPASVGQEDSEKTTNRSLLEERLAMEQSQRRRTTHREEKPGTTARILVTPPPSSAEEMDQGNVQNEKPSENIRTLITPPPPANKQDLSTPDVQLKKEPRAEPQEKPVIASKEAAPTSKELEARRAFEKKAQDDSMSKPMMETAPRTLITPPPPTEGKETKDEAPKPQAKPQVSRARKPNAEPIRAETSRTLAPPPPQASTTEGVEPPMMDLFSSVPAEDSQSKANQELSEQAKEASRRRLLKTRLSMEKKQDYVPEVKDAATSPVHEKKVEPLIPDPLSFASPAVTAMEGQKGKTNEVAMRKLLEARLAMEQKARDFPLAEETITTPPTASKQKERSGLEGLSELDARVLLSLLQDTEQVDLKAEAPRTKKTRASQAVIDVTPPKKASSVSPTQSKDARAQEASMRKLLEARLTMEQSAKKRAETNKEGYTSTAFVRSTQPQLEQVDVAKVDPAVAPPAFTDLEATVVGQEPKKGNRPSMPMKSDTEFADVEDSLMNAANAVFINDLQRPKTEKKTMEETEPVLATSTTTNLHKTETSRVTVEQAAELAKKTAFALASGCASVVKEGFQIAVNAKDNFNTTKVGASDITYQEAVKKISTAVQGLAKIIIILVKDVVNFVTAVVPCRLERKGLSNTISDQHRSIADSSPKTNAKGENPFASATSTFDAAVKGAFGAKSNKTATKKDGGDSPYFLDIDD